MFGCLAWTLCSRSLGGICFALLLSTDSKMPYGCEDGGPLPVRNGTHLSGLPELRLREVRQVAIGDDLLGVAIRFVASMLICQGCFLLERPKDLGGDHPSIWRLQVVKFLLAYSNVRFYHVQQGLYGAQSAKPTTFLIVNPHSDTESILAEHRTCATCRKLCPLDAKTANGRQLCSRRALRHYVKPLPRLRKVSWKAWTPAESWRNRRKTLKPLLRCVWHHRHP